MTLFTHPPAANVRRLRHRPRHTAQNLSVMSASGASRRPSTPQNSAVLPSLTPRQNRASLHMADRARSGAHLRSPLAPGTASCRVRPRRRLRDVLAQRKAPIMLVRSLPLRPGSGIVVRSSRWMPCRGSRGLSERLPARRKWLPRTWQNDCYHSHISPLNLFTL